MNSLKYLATALLLLLATPAIAGNENITVELTPQETVAIVRSMDRWPFSERAPDGFFDVQTKLGRALAANPAAREAVKKLETKR